MVEWNKCAHEWAVKADSDLGDIPGVGPREEVYCPKCGCPGERMRLCRNTQESEVYWPTT